MLRRLRYWIESARRSEELREEMELHLAEKAAELQANGMTVEDARAEARRRFGNVGLKQEESREIWITRFWSELGQDVRYGCRTITANKAFSAVAVLSLALGIGANTAIYSFMESIRSEEHTSELQSLAYLVCRLLLEKKNVSARYVMSCMLHSTGC